jgi:hypothetical protein
MLAVMRPFAKCARVIDGGCTCRYQMAASGAGSQIAIGVSS